ncbi:MAG: MgtC/SapB family protein [Ruminococcaceae bacterium]|nr:MgtC/SapB family protein [Oscillospiraceae bacterium]
MTGLEGIFTVGLRSLVAVLIGLFIGMERARHGRAAGMRTHVLVCLGSAVTAMTGLYINEIAKTGDVLRLAAQVISGVGFLGAGMIILKNDNMIMGLTTAAGVWATATLGIAVGYGFYSGALIGAFFFLITLTLFSKFERRKKNTLVVYVELTEMTQLNNFIKEAKEKCPAEPTFRVYAPISGSAGHLGIDVVMDRRKGLHADEFLELEGVAYAFEA